MSPGVVVSSRFGRRGCVLECAEVENPGRTRDKGRGVVEVGRVVGTQLSIGAAASAIVVATDIVLGESGRGKLNHPATALVFGGMIASAQSKALARLAARVTLPTQRVIAPSRGQGR